MMILRIPPKFEHRMTRLQTILGWIYLVMHIAVLPLLLSLYEAFSPTPVSEAQINLIYFGLGVLFVLCVMLRYLRDSFDILLDRLRLCLVTVLMALIIDYALSSFVALLLLLGGDVAENPNNNAVLELAAQNSGVTRALAIFIGPIVEEVLFRGVVFGSIRTRSRFWAYFVSVALFSLCHVWQYAAATGDPRLLLFALQYVPVSAALAWAYERSGCIWTTIFFHMGFNALSFTVLSMM